MTNTDNIKERGFTLFVALVVTGTLMLVGVSIVNLSIKQANISSAASDSQHAFYAADTGLECAFYWDVRNPSGISAFSPSPPAVAINCNEQFFNGMGGSASSEIYPLHLAPGLAPNGPCARVRVTKTGSNTTVESYGYNTCNLSSPRRVERGIRATY